MCELALLQSHGYGWNDLRQRRASDVAEGGVMFDMNFSTPYWTGGSDGEIASALGSVPHGAAWTLERRDPDDPELVTVVRHDGQRHHTGRVPHDRKVLAVITGGKGSNS